MTAAMITTSQTKELKFEEYIKNCHNILSERILEDIKNCKQQEKWNSLSNDKEKHLYIDNHLIDPGIVKKYSHIKVDHQYRIPTLYKHSWFTKSQLDLYENLTKEYKYPTDNKTVKHEETNKKALTMTKIDDKFKQELINELKLKQFSNDQIHIASQKVNNSLINKIKNKVNSSKIKTSKDHDDRQNLVDVKVHQIVPSKPKAPPPPPPTVKIKVTPVTSPIVDDKVLSHAIKTEINEKKNEILVETKNSITKKTTKIKTKTAYKNKKAPPPPAVHKPVQKENYQDNVSVNSIDVKSVQSIDEKSMDTIDTKSMQSIDMKSEDSEDQLSTKVNSPTKSFCSIDDIPKTGFDFLDNW